MTEDQIKHMVNRFLGWRLPESFNPDAGISFKKTFNEHTAWPMKHEPTGTNLFDAGQADAMVRYMIEGVSIDEQGCPGHVASDADPKICGRCGVHIDSLRPDPTPSPTPAADA